MKGKFKLMAESVSLLLLLFSPFLHAAETVPVEPEQLLVKNVHLIDPDDDTATLLVNLIIIDQKLDIVTQDEVDEESMTEVIDASNGVLLGKMEIGEPASFMILDEDPRKNFKVLLDTKEHVSFAISNGVVVKNTLTKVAEVTPKPKAKDKKPKQTGWVSYVPPPHALPTSYKKGKRRWNAWDNDYFNGIVIGGLLLDRQRGLSQDSASERQVGDLDDFEGGEIRALRLGVVGQIKFDTPWVYTLFGASNAFNEGFEQGDSSNIKLFDYRLDIPLTQKNTLSIGKQKEPLSMERLMTLLDNPMQERTAVSDALMPNRNVGIVLNGYGFDQRATWAGGIFNDWFDANQDFDESASQVVGRVTWLPYLSENESTLLHLGFGGRYTDAKEGVRYGTEPEFNNSPLFADTGLLSANNAMTYNLEATMRTGPFWVAGQYTRTDVDSPALNDPTLDGYSVTMSWIMTGEMRSYKKRSGTMGRVPVAKSVYQGGWGAWETAVRWSSLDLNDGVVQGGDLDIFSLGLNWYLSPIFTANINYRYITLDKPDQFGNSLQGDSSGINTRIVLILE
jgi:phosphate-selective porin OprO and OprP